MRHDAMAAPTWGRARSLRKAGSKPRDQPQLARRKIMLAREQSPRTDQCAPSFSRSLSSRHARRLRLLSLFRRPIRCRYGRRPPRPSVPCSWSNFLESPPPAARLSRNAWTQPPLRLGMPTFQSPRSRRLARQSAKASNLSSRHGSWPASSSPARPTGSVAWPPRYSSSRVTGSSCTLAARLAGVTPSRRCQARRQCFAPRARHALENDPNLLVLGPAAPPVGLDDLQPVQRPERMTVHTRCSQRYRSHPARRSSPDGYLIREVSSTVR